MFRGGHRGGRGGRGGQFNNNNRKSGDTQVKDNRTPNQTNSKDKDKDKKPEPSKPANKDVNGRPRSRSPVGRKDKPAEEKPAKVVDAGESSTPEEVPKGPKPYTGRPGEKKFNGRCRLFVANLGNVTSEAQLREEFGEFGETGEVFVNKEKGFGFIRLDYRHNAEMAKLSLDKKLVNGRNIQVRYATHASAIELHGLDNYASNEFIERAMSTFGAIERCIVVCDDRGRSKGYAVVEFEWKKAAAKVLDRLKDEMFVLGRLPKPVFAKPFVMQDEEEGVTEESLQRLDGLEVERQHEPRFIPPNSFEYVWAKRWRDLFIEEQDKKARLEQEMTDARCKLEFEMEAALRQNEASRIREELERRQEELKLLSEDMMRRQEADMRILERSRQREMAARSGNPEPPPSNEEELYQNEMQLSRENAARHQDFNQLRQRAEMAIMDSPFGGPGGPPMRQQQGPPQDQYYRGGPPQQYGGGYGGQGMDYRDQQYQQQRGPPMRDSRDMPSREIPAAHDQPAIDLTKDTGDEDTAPEGGASATQETRARR